MSSNGNGRPAGRLASGQNQVTKSMMLPDGEQPLFGMMIVTCASGSTYVSWPCEGDDVTKPKTKPVLQLLRDALHILWGQVPDAPSEPPRIHLAHGKLPPFPSDR